MNNEELNKRIHEILGMCLHETRRNGFYTNVWVCNKCKENFEFCGTLDFTTSWEGFGILIEWWMKHPLYPNFHKFMWEEYKYNQSFAKIIVSIPEKHLSPLALTQATVEFFKEK